MDIEFFFARLRLQRERRESALQTHLYIPLPHFLHGIVYRPRCESHVGQRWILGGSGGHTAAVGDEYIFTGVHLIPFIEHRRFWVFSHPDAAHFVVFVAGYAFGISSFDMDKTGFGEHFRKLLVKILHHF